MPNFQLPSVDVVLSWSREPTGKTAVLLKEEDGNWDELGRTEETEFQVEGLHPDRAYDFAAAPVLSDGGLAPEADWEKVRVAPMADEGTPALPQAPSGFAAAQDGTNLNLRWDAAVDGVTESYEVRCGDSWEDGVLVADGIEGSPPSGSRGSPWTARPSTRRTSPARSRPSTGPGTRSSRGSRRASCGSWSSGWGTTVSGGPWP